MQNKRLTKTGVENATADTEKDVFVWDTEVIGFGVRVTRNGCKSFVLAYRIKNTNTSRRLTIGKFGKFTVETARKEARRLLDLVNEGRDPAQEKKDSLHGTGPKKKTFGELAQDYLVRYASKKKSAATDRRILEKDFIPVWANRPAASIKRHEVIEVLDTITERGPAIGNRSYSVISRLFSWAMDKDILERSPCVGVKKPGGKEKPRERVLSRDEIKAFWTRLDETSLSPTTREVLRLALVTGQRVGEVCGMAWEELDLEKKVWEIPGTRMKNKETHRVPLSDLALEIIGRQERNGTHVFPGINAFRSIKPGTVSRAAVRYRSDFAMAHFTVHDLRRTAATNMAELRVPQFIIGRVLGHKPKGVTSRYDRYEYEDEKRQALELWADRIREIVTGKPKVIPLKKDA